MDETLPHFAMGKSSNLLSVAASLWEVPALRRPAAATATGAAHKGYLKRFDILPAPTLRFTP